MSLPISEAANRALQEAGRERHELANRMREVLEIDGDDYTYALKELGYEGGSDAPAVLVEVVLGVRLPTEGPDSVSGKELTLTVAVEGDAEVAEFVALRGTIVEVYAEGRLTFLTAATGGYAAKRSIKRTLEYTAAPPSLVLFEALSDLPYRGVEIEPVESPTITANGSEAFRPLDKRTDLLSAVRNEARIVAADRPDNVASAYSEASVSGEGSRVVAWSVEEGRDCDFGAVGVETSETERYAAVVAYTETRDGSQVEVARAEVDNHGVPVDPEDTLDLLFSYESDAQETGGTGGAAAVGEAGSAFELCFREALKLSVAPVTLSVPVVYRPYQIVRGDVIEVKTREFSSQGEAQGEGRGEVEGEWVRDYLMRVDSISGGKSRRDGSLSGAAELVGKRFSPLPSSPGDVRDRVSVSTALYGRDHRGRIRFSESLPWVTVVTDAADESGLPSGLRLLRLDVDVAAMYGVEIAKDGRNVRVSK